MKKIAIVTGASSGLGRAISIELAKNDFFVILSSRSVSGMKKTKSIILDNKGECSLLKLNVTDEKSIDYFKNEVSNIGSPTVIVNNAGVGIFNNVENTTKEDWDLQLAVNLTGPFLITKAFVEDMKKNKNGIIVFINSTAGTQAYPYSSAYVASKHGLNGFTKSLREELRSFNIRVVSIHPGAINTPLWDNVKSNFPRSEMMNVKEVASSVMHTIQQNKIGAIEEIVIRRVKGDF